LVELRDDFGVHRSLLQAGPSDLVLFKKAEDLSKVAYISIIDGPAKGDIRKVLPDPTHPKRKLALFDRPLSEVTTAKTEYQLMQQLSEGKLLNVDDDTAVLNTFDGASADDYILVGEQLRKIQSAKDPLITLTAPWDPKPDSDTAYVLLRSVGK